MSNPQQKSPVKYIPFSSTIEPSFWLKVSDHKLNEMKLDEGPVPITSKFGINPSFNNNNNTKNSVTIPPRMRLDQNSLKTVNLEDDQVEVVDLNLNERAEEESTEKSYIIENEMVHCPSMLYVYNTSEAFKRVDKNAILKDHMKQILTQLTFTSNEELSTNNNVSILKRLTSMILISFLDLKKHVVVYWCAFPAIISSTGSGSAMYESTPTLLSDIFLEDQERHNKLALAFHQMRLQIISREEEGGDLPCYFVIHNLFHNDDDNEITCTPLQDYSISSSIENEVQATSVHSVCFAFLDPVVNDSNNNQLNPGWPLRNLIAYLSLHPSLNLGGQTLQFLSFRPKLLRRIDLQSQSQTMASVDNSHQSVFYKIQIPESTSYYPQTQEKENPMIKVVGWEKNPKFANKMVPRTLSLSHLLSPSHLSKTAVNLNLSLMKWRQIPSLNTRKLETQTKCLLLGAGTLGCNVARTLLGWGITHITFVDNGKVTYSNPARQPLYKASDVGKDKAQVAADALKEIIPGITSEGITMSIPMPGHVCSSQVEKEISTLETLIEQHDIIFLLTDTRESRWLPTLLCKVSKKILINAALGFDTYLVMRCCPTSSTTGVEGEGDLGCYFCNDVVAPENSTRERTLDQQCTVTRPGLALIASALAVELMVALLHADDNNNDSNGDNIRGGALGIIPHQIRGSISSHTIMTPKTPAFQHCTCCSKSILDSYSHEFVRNVCNQMNGEYLDEISGLKEFRRRAEEMVDFDWDDDEEDEDLEGEGGDDF